MDYAKSLDCIHCGLCLRTCPTYRLSGRESASPRGRVHLMRAVGEGRLEADAEFEEEMDFCLVCRNCESVCPAGVEFGAMMEFTRDQLEATSKRSFAARWARRLGFGVVLRRRWALQLTSFGLRLAQRTGILKLITRPLGARGAALRAVPEVPPLSERRALPPRTPASGPLAEAVSLLTGCVMPEMFGRVNRASAEVLSAAGAEVLTAPGHVCCGALHAHNGDLQRARELARSTIEAFERNRDEAGEPLSVVVGSAGCGAHMKEYGRLFAGDAKWETRGPPSRRASSTCRSISPGRSASRS